MASFDKTNKILSFIKRPPSNLLIKINGNNFAESSVATSTVNNVLGTFYIGKNLNGHIGEVIVFNRGLKDSEIEKVENYLSQKWGINLE